MSAISPSVTPVTLRSVSGKSLLLTPPVTLATVLEVATAPPFSFAPESVKVILHGRIVRLLQYQQQHGSDLFKLPLDASAYTPPRTTAKCANSVVLASSSSSGAEFKAEPRSVIVYGVPQRIRATASAPRSGAQEPVALSTPFAEASGKSLPLSTPPRAGQQECSDSTCTTVAATPTTAKVSRRASLVRLPINSPTTHVAAIKGPLPYPHSPDGLHELGKICAEFDSDDDEDLITLLQGAPPSIYNHPTVLYMSNKVKGDLVILQAAMEQIARVSPVFFDWIVENPQRFLSALNRGGERSLQQVKDQLRMLAMRAMADQMSGETPSRHVMMLEVNTRDGSPDVYQVEVQVGDFSDASTPSDSLTANSLADNNSAEEEREDGEDSVNTGDELEENDTAASSIDASAKDGGVAGGTEEEEEEDERHRGAILLSSTPAPHEDPLASHPPSDAVPSPDRAVTGAMLSNEGSVTTAEERTSAEERELSLTPSTPADAVARRSFPPLPSTSSTAARSASLNVAASLATPAVSPHEDIDAEDVLLSGLRKELQHVHSLTQQWVHQATGDAAHRTHTAIMKLRRDLFTVLNDLITTSSTPASLLRSFGDVRRLALLACDFFSAAEEFYVQLDEQGVRSSVFGETPQDSVAAWAVVAALSRLLVCDVDAAVERQLQQGAPGLSRVGALRSLQHINSIRENPALRWTTAEGPEELLMALLQLCRQQRAVVLWYSSHYVLKEVGKTIQTMAYILGGRGEAQQTVTVQRLKVTSKAHKQDEVADCITTLSDARAETDTLSYAVRCQWFSLMRSRYQRLVLPIEKDLPLPHMTSDPLYVCDTRHVLPPKGSGARPETLRGTMDSAARWWAGYCDDRHTCCADKWCLALTERLWNVVTAMENATAEATAENVALVLTCDGTEASSTNSLSLEAAARDWLGDITWIPVDKVVVPSAATASTTVSRSVARHSAVLFEQVCPPAEAKDETAAADHPSSVAGVHGMPPLFSGDVHMVDVAAMAPGHRPVLELACGAALPTYLATVVRNFVLPASARERIFLRHLFGMFAKYPRIPVAAAVRDAALANARCQDSPWLVSEYVLYDYGGALSTFANADAKADTTAAVGAAGTAKPASSTTAAALPSPMTNPSTECVSDNFVRMPSVPLSKRLSMPRPLPPTQRRPVRATLRSQLARAQAAAGEMEKRQYARSHAVDELYEMMLGSLLEHRPTGEADVLDHLVHYVESSQDAMRDRVYERQAEAAAAAAQKVAHSTKPSHSAVGGGSGCTKPQPPGGKPNTFARRRQ
ncbi:conserved hypothetical protein [Leishmania mexicana MHOM/GT/2001/U1103]|uniref:Uncharacterized protein n=1 Tax=Leishmania mexicana (strain MHOM/GT/2001/U1103) TaxID=929439 RepID=E9ASJ5_LEIMU|nr:conserved hypothetical protein [Leishmania mexicana MHOM/GT/2001/U1103]CBZ25918.1 conserved hypothetical protein [Leishmania mexicana MHOM/GT/2001/U1103]